MTLIAATGQTLSEEPNPDIETTMEYRYGHLVPGIGESAVDFAHGRHNTRPELPIRDRYLASIATLSALGANKAPQLRKDIMSGRKVGLSREEIGEVIWQMAVYGGFLGAINALNVAIEVFDNEERD